MASHYISAKNKSKAEGSSKTSAGPLNLSQGADTQLEASASSQLELDKRLELLVNQIDACDDALNAFTSQYPHATSKRKERLGDVSEFTTIDSSPPSLFAHQTGFNLIQSAEDISTETSLKTIGGSRNTRTVSDDQIQVVQMIKDPNFQGELSVPVDHTSSVAAIRGSRSDPQKPAVAILSDWLQEHESYPYPTQVEKQKLADLSGLQINQINTRLSNARKRMLRNSTSNHDFSTGLLSDAESLHSSTPANNRKRSRGASTASVVISRAEIEPTFQCTFCSLPLSKSTWRRHEESQHVPQEYWKCMATGPTLDNLPMGDKNMPHATCVFSECDVGLCFKDHRIAECLARHERERIFYRKDLLKQHVQIFHASALDDSIACTWKIQTENATRSWWCGFCAKVMDTWNEREVHIESHFLNGATMASWDPNLASRLESTVHELRDNHLLSLTRDERKPEQIGRPSIWTCDDWKGVDLGWDGDTTIAKSGGQKMASNHIQLSPRRRSWSDSTVAGTDSESPIQEKPLRLPTNEIESSSAEHAESVGALKDVQISDIQSVRSLDTFQDSGFFSGQSSYAKSETTTLPQTAKQRLLSLFCSDVILGPLFKAAVQKIDKDRFARNVRRLLVQYCIGLVREARHPSDKVVLAFLGGHLPWLAAQIHESFDVHSSSRRLRMEQALRSRQNIDKQYMLEKYFSQHGALVNLPFTLVGQVAENGDANSVGDAEASETMDTTDYRRFLTTGAAFETLRKNLREFVTGRRSEEKKVSVEKSMDLPSSKAREMGSNELSNPRRPKRRRLEPTLHRHDVTLSTSEDFSKHTPAMEAFHNSEAPHATRTPPLPSVGSQSIESASNSPSPMDEPGLSSAPRDSSTEGTEILNQDNLPSPGQMDDETSGLDDTIREDDRLLNPREYFRKIRSLRSVTFHRSAIRYYSETKHERIEDVDVLNPSAAQELAPEHGLRIPFSAGIWDPTSRSDDIVLQISRSAPSPKVLDFLECRNIMQNSSDTLKYLQENGFCNDHFSMLVLDQHRPTVATLLPVKIADVAEIAALFDSVIMRLGKPTGDLNASKSPISFESGKSSIEIEALAAEVTSSCSKLLNLLQVGLDGPIGPVAIWRFTAHTLDLAIVSYTGAHTEYLGESSRESPVESFTIPGVLAPIRGQVDQRWVQEHRLCMRRRKFRCFDQFLAGNDVWVFHPGPDDMSDERLCLSTDIDTLTDIWGPAWKTKTDAESNEIFQYCIGNGYIVPWDSGSEDTPQTTTQPESGNEVFCHWVSSRDWSDDIVEKHQMSLSSKHFFETDRLLIGATVKDQLAVNGDCEMSSVRKLQIKQRLKDKGDLKPTGTRPPRRYHDSQSYQISASACGFATVGSMMTFKRENGFNLKDAIIERWRNGRPNISLLELWGGVEVSLCTQNARRRTLRHILRSQGLRNYLKTISFKWDDENCEKLYFDALTDRRTFQNFWNDHPVYHENVGNAINECLSALEETGVDSRDNELSALWVESFKADNESVDENRSDAGSVFVAAQEHLVILRRSEHSWTGFLNDSSECLTMAVVGDICLDFDDSECFGMRCRSYFHFSKDGRYGQRHAPGYSVLQTALHINESLSEPEGLLYQHFDFQHQRKRKFEDIAGDDLSTGVLRTVGPRTNIFKPLAHLVEFFGESEDNWNGYWNVTSVRKGSKFNLGYQGYLKLYNVSKTGHSALMEWDPLSNVVGKEMKEQFKERALGKSGDKHHWEFMEGSCRRSPLPCLVLSRTKPEN